MFCTKCGASYNAGDAPRFCRQCGAQLKQPAASPKAPPQQNRSAPSAARHNVNRQPSSASQTPGRQPDRFVSSARQPGRQPEHAAHSAGNSADRGGQRRSAAAPRMNVAPAPVTAPPVQRSKKWIVFACAGLLILLAAVVLLAIVLHKGSTGNIDSAGSAVNVVQVVSGAKKLSGVRSCNFDLTANDGGAHITGAVKIADDFASSCAILQLPDKDGEKSYAYLHEGRLMMVNGTGYITGANIKGLSEVFSGESGGTLDAILGLLNVDTGPLNYEDCVTLFNAMRDAVEAMAANTDTNDRLDAVSSILIKAAVPLLKLRNAGTAADENKDAALNLLEAFLQSGVSKEAMQLSGTSDAIVTCTLTITPAVFFKELVAFCKTSEDFKSICDNLQTTPEEALSAYTDEALQNTFGGNKAILSLGMTNEIMDRITLDYADKQVFKLTLSDFDAAVIDEASYEFIEDMRSDPNVENAYIDNYIDILKQFFS